MAKNAAAWVCPECGGETPPHSRFCASCGARMSADALPAWINRPDAIEGGPFGADEMRPVTSLFADIVGSTSLGERLPPDEVKALIGECVNRMSGAVEAFGGTVQAYLGDGICAYFGVPVAHSDDAERAARAALRILRVVGDYGNDIADAWGESDFNVRIGINSGVTAVGKVGSQEPQDVALGDATNVAARLQAHAEPGTIVVGEETAKQLRTRFVLRPLGPVQVKGRSRHVDASLLGGPRKQPAPATSAPFLGRAEELARLAAVMEGLAAGRGQVLVLLGEPGLGKSRTLEELQALAPEGTTWLSGHCSSYGGELPYWPFVEILRGWLEVEEGDAEIAVRTKLRAKLGRVMGSRTGEVLSQLGALLGIDVDAESAPRGADLTSLIPDAYALWIESLAGSGPVVVALDDLHWADEATAALADHLLGVTDVAPVALVGALEPQPGSRGWAWRMRVLGDFSHRAMEITLRPLTLAASEELVDALTPAGRLDGEARSQILERSEGNPLYIEQFIRALLEAGGVERRRTWSVSPRGSLPTTVEALLVARVDRLSKHARKVAQAAAVIGRRFSRRVLVGVLGDDEMSRSLGELLRAGIVRETRRYPELEYAFTHGLLQDAALSTLTPAGQRSLSGRVGILLEDQFVGSGDDDPEVLAYYFYRSEHYDKALAYLERAADRARAVNATSHAAQLLRRAMKVARRRDGEEGAAEERLRGVLAELPQ